MSVTGLCAICERPELDHGCDRCGQLVCERHWDESLGVCTDCSSDIDRRGERRREDDERERPVREDGPDGVDTYRY